MGSPSSPFLQAPIPVTIPVWTRRFGLSPDRGIHAAQSRQAPTAREPSDALGTQCSSGVSRVPLEYSALSTGPSCPPPKLSFLSGFGFLRGFIWSRISVNGSELSDE